MVTQHKQFILCEKLDLYIKVNIETSSNGSEDKSTSKHQYDTITITIFSYKSNLNTIKNYVDNLTKKHLALIENSRKNKLFIYTLIKAQYVKKSFELWNEIQFLSTRTFSNIFFKEKNDIIKKIDFFLHNKQWFYDKGIPYSLGIGTYGPPGTGKTSIIKSIANYTNRNIIVISLKLIKTKIQLNNIFFEEFYNENNNNVIGFDKKIIVFEDIDCIGDIVLDRNLKSDKYVKYVSNSNDINEKINEKISKKIDEKISETISVFNENDLITLDDILNLWDGIRETSGRIMIISSNYYHKLDSALVRPGRIDITLELSYVSHQIIKEMYIHFFEQEMDDNILQNIKEDFYTPAEITNIYMNSNNNKDIFIEKILQNKHI
jgi:SpoVK/Ycf46/Vps4 family AAA+-type ATPase